MTMKEICSKSFILIRCVSYIIDEKPKIQWFLSFFPIMFKEGIEYDNLEMLEEAMRKENICYEKLYPNTQERMYICKKIIYAFDHRLYGLQVNSQSYFIMFLI